MSFEPRRGQRLLAELKRRRVFRAAAVYGGAAFALIQVVEPVAQALRLPEAFLPLAVLLLLLGFPVALAAAWVYEMTPEGVQRTEAAAPEEIAALVAQPASRRWGAAAAGLVGLAVLLGGAWYAGRSSAQVAEGFPDGEPEASVAVLPFVNMSSDEEQEYFSEGIAEEVLNLLTRVQGLKVAARTSSFAFSDESLPVPEIARRLNVGHVLEGSVRKDGDEVRVTAQLIRAEDGFHLWSDTWDRTLDDIFAIQDEIAADVAEHLRVTLLGGAPTVEATDPRAFSLVLQARHFSDLRTPEDLAKAEGLFRDALAIAPEYAAGWSGLALNLYRADAVAGETGRSGEARRAAEKAVALDPGQTLAYLVLGRLSEEEGDLKASARHLRKALTLEPGDARVEGAVGLFLQALGRVEEAIPFLEYQAARDPVGPPGHVNLGLAYLSVGRPGRAARSFETALELSPSMLGVRGDLAIARLLMGEGKVALREALMEPEEVSRQVALVAVYHALGRKEESDAALAAATAYERTHSYNIAYAVAYRGDVDGAFRWLEKAALYQDSGLTEVIVRPEFEVLHEDPRWEPFLQRIGRSRETLAAVDFQVEPPR